MQVDKARLDESISADRDRLIHILVVHFHMFRDKAEEAADLFLHHKTIADIGTISSLRSTEGKGGEPVAWQTRHPNHNNGRWVNDEAEDVDYRAASAKLGWQFRPLYATPEAAEAHVAKLREALEEMRSRDDRNGSLPPAYREIIDGALSGATNTYSVGGAIYQSVGECLAGMNHKEVSVEARRKIDVSIRAALTRSPE